LKQILTILLLLFSSLVFGNTIVVGKDQVITSVKKAVEIAKAGDSILLQKGTYKEHNIIINKPLQLIGVGKPVLDGENKYEILTVSGERIVIKGIVFKNSGYSTLNDLASIDIIDSHDLVVENNTILNANFGIHINNSNNCLVQNNYISGIPKTEETSGNGIHLWKCDSMLVKDNDITGQRDGIYFEFVTNSIIEQNVSHNNIRYGLHFMFSNHNAYMQNTFRDNGAGVAVMFSNHIVMQGNNFQHNWGANSYGLLLKEISDGQIVGNHFDHNTAGIVLESTNRIEVLANKFTSNGWALRMSASCNENVVKLNDFNANTFDVATNGTLSLNKFYNNYWDKYEGYDMNKDGIGDVPYHPVSMYSMVIEQNPNSLILLRSFMVTLLDKAEKAIPSLTPENMVDEQPIMKNQIR
jgi:nitrous oxidase accessory protein